jgi:hypothetical protein
MAKWQMGASFLLEFRFTLLSIIPPKLHTVFIYMLLLPAEQTDKAWQPSDKECSIADRGTLDREALSRLLFPHARTRIKEGDPKTAFNTRTKNMATGPSSGALRE